MDSRACIDVFGLPGDPHDSEEAFFEDMIVEGDFTNDQRLVEIHVREAARRTKELVDWGARIDRLTFSHRGTGTRGGSGSPAHRRGTQNVRYLGYAFRQHSCRDVHDAHTSRQQHRVLSE